MMIEIKNLYAGYDKNKSAGSEVLHDVSCSVPEGKITVLAGPNGSGKTTLIKVLGGQLEKWSGEVLINGRDISQITPKERAKLVSVVSQTRFIPDLTCAELVLCGRFPYTGFPSSYSQKDRKIAINAMQLLQVESLADKALAELSGGQRQKIYLAMCLAQDTPVMILDEPLTYLDVRQQVEFLKILAEFAANGKTVILVMHDLNLIFRFSDRIILLKGGKCAASGSCREIASSGIADDVFEINTSDIYNLI